MKNYDKLIAKSNFFIVDWLVGSVCNFNCSYCMNALHDNKHPFVDVEIAKRFVENITKKHEDKVVVFILSGGEPVLWKDLPELMRFIKQKNGEVHIISNGSKRLEWWEENTKMMDVVLLSFHWDYSDQDKIMKVAKIAVRNEVSVKVNILATKEMFDETYELAERMAHMVPGAVCEVRVIRKDHGGEMIDYTEEQVERLKERIRFGWPRYGKIYQTVYTDAGEKFTPQDAIINQKNCWKGWKCYIGIETLKVSIDGTILRGNCGVGGPLGNINGEVKFPDEPVICNQDLCGCVTDIKTTKERM